MNGFDADCEWLGGRAGGRVSGDWGRAGAAVEHEQEPQVLSPHPLPPAERRALKETWHEVGGQGMGLGGN